MTTSGYQAVDAPGARLQIDGQDIPRVSEMDLRESASQLAALKEVTPLIAAIDAISKSSVSELKALGKPPRECAEVGALVLLLLDGADPKKTQWKDCQKMLSNPNSFISRCKSLQPEDIAPARLEAAKQELAKPYMTLDHMKAKSLAAACLVKWADGMVKLAQMCSDGAMPSAVRNAMQLLSSQGIRRITLAVPMAGWWNVDMPYRVVILTGRLVLGRERVGAIDLTAVGMDYRAFTQAQISPGLEFKVTARANAEVSLQVTCLEFPADDRLSLVNMTDPFEVVAYDVMCPGRQFKEKLGPFTTPRVSSLVDSADRSGSFPVPTVSLGDLNLP